MAKPPFRFDESYVSTYAFYTLATLFEIYHFQYSITSSNYCNPKRQNWFCNRLPSPEAMPLTANDESCNLQTAASLESNENSELYQNITDSNILGNDIAQLKSNTERKVDMVNFFFLAFYFLIALFQGT